MENIKKITNEILDLRGSKVSIFGQQVELDAEVSPYTIDVVDILNALENYEVEDFVINKYNEETDEYIEENAKDIDTYLSYLEDFDELKELRSDNSYNWNSNISNDLQFTMFKYLDSYLVKLRVHKFGDVRCNYTDDVLLKFNREDELIQLLYDCYKNENITIEENSYNLEINPLNEGIEVYDIEKDEDIGTIYGYYSNSDEVIEDIKDLIS